MRKAGAFLLLLLMGLSPLFAQERDDDPEVEPDWGDYTSDMYVAGDQTIVISLGTIFPAVFVKNGNIIDHQFTPPVGGVGFLSYNYYITSNFFVGAELRGLFLFTIAGNAFFSPQIGANAGYQFNIWKLEFPIAAGLGMAWHNYLNFGYYGLYLKASAGAYFRATTSWSFGLVANWEWLPEWTNDKTQNVDGNVWDIMLSARYHF